MQYNDRRTVERNLVHAVLAGADVIPGEIERAVRYGIEHDLGREAPRGYVALRDEISTPWAISSLARFLPGVLADATRNALLIMPPNQEDDGVPYRASGDHLGLGIRDEIQHYFPPSPFKGPFLALLRLAPQVGLQLVLDLANHATDAWIARERAPRYGRAGNHPLPQRLTLKAAQEEGQAIWGDATVWRWFRYTAVAPNPLVCALMAFERWLSDRAEADANMERVFTSVMRRTQSAAIIGVLASIAVKYPDRCAAGALPILRCSAFYFMDHERLTLDKTEAATRGLAELFDALSGNGGWREIQHAAREEHRKADLEWLALRLMLTNLQYRETLLPAIRAFPTHLPYTDEAQLGDVAAEAQLRQICEFLVLRTDVEQFDVVDVGEGQLALQPKKIPEHLLRVQEETEAKVGRIGELLGLQTWAMRLLEDEPPPAEGERYDPASALAAAKRLSEAPIEPEELEESAYGQELWMTTTTSVAAALLVHHRASLSDPEDVQWCRAQLLQAASAAFDEPSSWDEEFAVYSWGTARSAARALPYLLAERPDDADLRESVALLCIHGAREVRSLAYSALGRLWLQMPAFVWDCLKLGVGLALRRLSVRRGNPPDTLLQWLNAQLHEVIDGTGAGKPASLCDRAYQAIDWAILESVVQALPSRVVYLPDKWDHRLLNLYEDWLRFTLAVSEQVAASQHQWRSYQRIPDEWSRVFFARLSGRLLSLDATEAQVRFLAPMLAVWERAPELLETFMRTLLMEASAKDAPVDVFVALWKHLGTAVLAADKVRAGRFHYDHGVEGVLAILVCGDPMTTWRTDTFEPVARCADLITEWCRVVGHVPNCFRALIRLLSSVGFRLFTSHGVAWLSVCLGDDDVANALLAEADIAQSLAALLTKAFQQHGSALRSADTSWRAFNAVVDRLVCAGEPAAAELQTRIRTRR